MEINEEYTLEVFDISTDGDGIGRADGVVTFVPGLIPGDRARVGISQLKKNIAVGKVKEILEASSDRAEPFCPNFTRCGGCSLQNMDYQAQLSLKEKQLRDKLDRIYGGPYPQPEAIVGMDRPFRYRNKAMYAINAGAARLQKDGSVKNSQKPRVGFYDGKGRNLVEAAECPIQSEAAEKVAGALREYIKRTGATVYDEKSRKGKLRQLMVRTGYHSHEVMVMLVMNGKKLPQPDLLGQLIFDGIDQLNDGVAERLDRAAVSEGFGGIYTVSQGPGADLCIPGQRGLSRQEALDLGCSPEDTDLDYDIIDSLDYYENWFELKSLVINHNQNRLLTDISTDMEVIYGSKVVRDSITVNRPCPGGEDDKVELEFEISPFSFYQVNTPQMEKLYSTVLEFASLKGDETVLDLYCGVGTIGLCCCAAGAGYVWGIESVKSAVIDANRNAVINGLVNIRFLQGKAEEKIFDLLDMIREEKRKKAGLPSEAGMDDTEKNRKNPSPASSAYNTADEPEYVSPDNGAAESPNASPNNDLIEISTGIDLVILDPPRAGCRPELLNAVMKAAPARIIYVSCDPGTLARDLKLLTGTGAADAAANASPKTEASPAYSGVSDISQASDSPARYTITRIRQVDQFCHTTHVETVCLLSNRKPDTKVRIDLDMADYYRIKDAKKSQN